MDTRALSKSSAMWPAIFLLAATFLWGTSFIAGKYALTVADAPIIVLMRFSLAALFWLPTFTQISSILETSQWRSLSVLAFLMIPATFLLQFIGLKYTSASSAAVMIGFTPLMVLVVGWIFWKEPLTRSDVLLSLLALIGVLFVMGWPKDMHFWGAFLVLLSSIVVGIWLRWSQVWMKILPVNHFTALTCILGTLLLIPLTLLLTRNWQFHWSWQGGIAIIYLGLGCSLLASWCWNKGMEHTKANLGGLFVTLEPIFGVIFAGWLLGDEWDFFTKLGIGLVFLPVLIASLLPLIKLRNISLL